MLLALEDLRIEKLWVVYPGSKEYALHDSIDLVPLTAIPGLADQIKT